MKKVKIRYPLNTKLIIPMLLLCGFEMLGYAVRNNGKHLHLILSILFFLVVVFAVIRRMLKPKDLEIQDDSIIIKDYKFDANENAKIYIENEKIIGIKPKKKRIVPPSLCFEMMSEKERSIFCDWAKRNSIEITEQTFMKWI